MKKMFSFLLIAFFLSSCTLVKYSTSSESVDLAKFNDQNILVTTGDIMDVYTPIKYVVSECYSGFVPKANKSVRTSTSKFGDDLYVKDSKNVKEEPLIFNASLSNYNYKFCSLDDIFQEIVNQAKDSGANGLINIKVTEVTREIKKQVSIGYRISGLAIKIK